MILFSTSISNTKNEIAIIENIMENDRLTVILTGIMIIAAWFSKTVNYSILRDARVCRRQRI